MDKVLPRFPVYVISKGRADRCLTAKFLVRDGVPFFLVVEPHEAEAYAAGFGAERILTLPFRDLGLGSVPARNWVWEHAKATGAERHWILDDNINRVCRRFRGKRFTCEAGVGFRVIEDFTDRYENVAMAGMQYDMFVADGSRIPPFYVNKHLYSCLLILNRLPFRWRGRYNEDTDLCLQVLAAGWCTVTFNAFCIKKRPTMEQRGGNTAELYQGDGRLRMARSLERVWPGVVSVDRRFNRPQHIVRDAWKRFDTPLKLKPGIDLGAIEPNDYGMRLAQVKPTKSPHIRELVKDLMVQGDEP